MAYSQDYLEFIQEQLEETGGITYKKMFGGVGLYLDGVMFGGIMGGTLHLKVDDTTRQEFIDRGMTPFYHGKKKKPMASYYEVPVEIVEDKDELKTWALKAHKVAVKAKND